MTVWIEIKNNENARGNSEPVRRLSKERCLLPGLIARVHPGTLVQDRAKPCKLSSELCTRAMVHMYNGARTLAWARDQEKDNFGFGSGKQAEWDASHGN